MFFYYYSNARRRNLPFCQFVPVESRVKFVLFHLVQSKSRSSLLGEQSAQDRRHFLLFYRFGKNWLFRRDLEPNPLTQCNQQHTRKHFHLSLEVFPVCVVERKFGRRHFMHHHAQRPPVHHLVVSYQRTICSNLETNRK